MAAQVSVKITLNPNFLREAKALGAALLDPITQQITSAIMKRSPFRFGTNRRSIEHTSISEFVRQIATTSGYGGWLTIGHRSKGGKMIAARPYFQEGLAYMAGQISKVTDARQLDRPLPDPGRPIMFGPARKAV